jgi:dihydroorotate dehydrogenase electron transfer subunit
VKRIDAKIVENKELFPNHFRIVLEAPTIAKDATPGQFLHVRISETFDPLLRRPFSISRIKEEGIEIIYKVVGKGTYLLSKKREGETLDILGPNGVGFDILGVKEALLVAGGIGVAPLLSLADSLGKKGVPTYILIGSKDGRYGIFEDELRMFGCYVNFATEDGSLGYAGLVDELLEKRLREGFPSQFKPSKIFSCGPFGMMRKVAELSIKNKIPHQVLLEEKMACGIGACLSCVVAIKGGGYLRTCKDGPVFDAERIDWRNEEGVRSWR